MVWLTISPAVTQVCTLEDKDSGTPRENVVAMLLDYGRCVVVSRTAALPHVHLGSPSSHALQSASRGHVC